MDPMALSIVDIKAHGISVTERATILAARRCQPNQAFPLSLFRCEESASLSCCSLGTCVPFTADERTRLIIGGGVLVGGIWDFHDR
jgi:hypothetical protein